MAAAKVNLKQIYLDDFVEVQVDDTIKFIFVTWLKHPGSQQFREVFSKLAELTIKNEMKYWLSDARAIHYVEFSDQNWLIQDAAPLLKQSRLLKFARLTTKENLELMDIVRVYQMIKQLKNLDIQTELELFTSKEEALHWLFPDQY